MRSAVSAEDSSSKFARRKMANPAYQAFQLLHCAFLIIPIVAGLDKFYMRLANWTEFLWSPIGSLAGDPRQFMRMVGIIEIAAGLLVAFKPKMGGYVVAVWMACIIINLLLQGRYYDVALRDLGLAFGALTLARLSHQFGYDGHHSHDSHSD